MRFIAGDSSHFTESLTGGVYYTKHCRDGLPSNMSCINCLFGALLYELHVASMDPWGLGGGGGGGGDDNRPFTAGLE